VVCESQTIPIYENSFFDSSKAKSYSRIEHLAKIPSLSFVGWRHVLMGMFTTAFDASGHESDQLIMVVAGFISSANDWIDFSKKWKERLAKDGLKYFHMKEFKYLWLNDEPRRRALLNDLMEVIRTHAYLKFGVMVSIKGFGVNFSEAEKEEWLLNAYSFAGYKSVKEVCKWAQREHIKSSIEHIFEEGDLGRGKLEKLAEDSGHILQFRPGKEDRTTDSGNVISAFVPLQAADFLAAEYFMEAERRLKRNTRRDKPRWGYLQFNDMRGTIRQATGEKLKDLHRLLEITKESDIFLGEQHKKGCHSMSNPGRKVYIPLSEKKALAGLLAVKPTEDMPRHTQATTAKPKRKRKRSN
jgi:hypothetical protein